MTQFEVPSDITPEGAAVARNVAAVIVMYPAFRQALDASVAMVNLSHDVGLPTGLILQAEPGMGKTLLTKLIVQTLSKADSQLNLPPKVPLTVLEAGVDVHQLALKLVMELGYPLPPSRPTLQNLTRMVDSAMDVLRPRALIFDEAQHLCEGTREITAKTATDWLKVRMDRHSCPCLLVGEKTVDRLYQINTQFVSRASAGYALEPLAYGREWINVLHSFDEQVQGYNLSQLVNDKCARRLHKASRGVFRDLKWILMHALISTARDGRKELSNSDLALGCDCAFGIRGDRENPFRLGT